MAKGKTNNPNGRPKATDPKIMIGVYVPESIIRQYATTIKDRKEALRIGKEHVREILKRTLGIN